MNMPPPSPELALIGALLHELETEFPGILDRMTDRLCHEENISKIARLRSPPEAPAVREAIASAHTWASRVTLVYARPKKKRG